MNRTRDEIIFEYCELVETLGNLADRIEMTPDQGVKNALLENSRKTRVKAVQLREQSKFTPRELKKIQGILDKKFN